MNIKQLNEQYDIFNSKNSSTAEEQEKGIIKIGGGTVGRRGIGHPEMQRKNDLEAFNYVLPNHFFPWKKVIRTV